MIVGRIIGINRRNAHILRRTRRLDVASGIQRNLPVADTADAIVPKREAMRKGERNMNKSKIEWCDYTWNPVTGCLYRCPYCYARRMARRFARCDAAPFTPFHGHMILKGKDCETGTVLRELDKPLPKSIASAYPFGFTPTFHRYRLNEPQSKKPGLVFVCSMADLFGKWVPAYWIENVLAACKMAPQHKYLFLSKNPERMGKVFAVVGPSNWWFGTTITTQKKVRSIRYLSKYMKRFVSIEPMIEPITLPPNIDVDWVIIGAESGNRKGKVTPKREWIKSLVDECHARSIPIFLKNSLAPIWGEPLIQQFHGALSLRGGY
jgi:protein gp37